MPADHRVRPSLALVFALAIACAPDGPRASDAGDDLGSRITPVVCEAGLTPACGGPFGEPIRCSCFRACVTDADCEPYRHCESMVDVMGVERVCMPGAPRVPFDAGR